MTYSSKNLLGTVSLCSLLTMGAGLASAQGGDGCYDHSGCTKVVANEIVITSNPTTAEEAADADSANFVYIDSPSSAVRTRGGRPDILLVTEDWSSGYEGNLYHSNQIRVGPGAALGGNINLGGGAAQGTVGSVVDIYHGTDIGVGTRHLGATVAKDADDTITAGDMVSLRGKIQYHNKNDRLRLRSERATSSSAGNSGAHFQITASGEVDFVGGVDILEMDTGSRLDNLGQIKFGAGHGDQMIVNGWISGTGTIDFSAGGTVSFDASKIDDSKSEDTDITPDGTVRIDNHVTLGSGGTVIADAAKIGNDGSLSAVSDSDVLALAAAKAKGFHLKKFTLGTGKADILAKSASTITGGDAAYNIYLGAIAIDSTLDTPGATISLGGGSTSDKLLKVGSDIPAGATISGTDDSRKDVVHITGGAGAVNLGAGANELTIGIGSSASDFSGTYTGGSGNDMVTVNSGASVSGTLDLGAGNNMVKAMGSITGSVTGGGGNDDVLLLSGAGITASIGDLGAGTNKVYVSSAASGGGSSSGPVTLKMIEGATNAGNNTITICGDGVDSDTTACDGTSLTNSAFNVVIEAAGPNFRSNWDVMIEKPSGTTTAKSKLKVVGTGDGAGYIGGKVTLKDPEIPMFTLVRSGKAGDEVFVAGTYKMAATAGGTLFELDVNPAASEAAGADTLFFNATPATPADSVGHLYVNLVAIGTDKPGGGTTPIVKLGATTDVNGLMLYGGDASGTAVEAADGAVVTLEGHDWRVETATDNSGVKTYSIWYRNPNRIITRDDEDDISGSRYVEMVTVRANWEGVYTGYSGEDKIVVDANYTAKGGLTLHGGNDEIWGEGTVEGSLNLGLGDDKIGVLDKAGPDGVDDTADDLSDADVAKAATLTLGTVDLGAGDNTMKAAAATTISAGEGNDNVYLKPKANFELTDVRLGGGTNKLWIIGDDGAADSRKASVTIRESAEVDIVSDTVSICGWYDGATSDCGNGAASGQHAFNVALSVTGDPTKVFPTIMVHNDNSSVQSHLALMGEVTLKEATLYDTTVSTASENGGGDVITLMGVPMIDDGTSFELHAKNGEGDSLVITESWPTRPGATPNDSPVPAAIALKVTGHGSATEERKSQQFTVLSVTQLKGRDVGRVTIEGMVDGMIELGGREWDLVKDDTTDDKGTADQGDDTMTTIYALRQYDPGTLHFEVDDDFLSDNLSKPTNLSKALQARLSFGSVTVVADRWSGVYTPYGETDDDNVTTRTKADAITINEGSVVSAPDNPATSLTWDLSGGNDTLTVLGGIGTNVEIQMGAGEDTVTASGRIDGVIRAGDGADTVNASGTISGDIYMGAGNDAISTSGTISGDIYMGAGNNTLKGSGTVTGKVEMGDEYDYIGDFANPYSADSSLTLSGEVDLGNGANIVNAKSATSITAGSGRDSINLVDGNAHGVAGTLSLGDGNNVVWARSVQSMTAGSGGDTLHLRPGGDNYTTTLKLGGGGNKVYLDHPDPGGVGKVTLSLQGDKPQGATNTLYLCDRQQCGDSNIATGAFNAVVGAAGSTLDWDSIVMVTGGVSSQSKLEMHGAATLNNPKLQSIEINMSNGKVGDAITIAGNYTIKDPSPVGPGNDQDSVERNLGTGAVFHLDVNLDEARKGNNETSSDVIRFLSARTNVDQNRDDDDRNPYIKLNITGDMDTEPEENTKVELVTVTDSDPNGIYVLKDDNTRLYAQRVTDLEYAKVYKIGGHDWKIYGERAGETTTYYLGFASGLPIEISDARFNEAIRAGNRDSLNFDGSRNGAVIVGNWKGEFTGLNKNRSTEDNVIVNRGVEVTGNWDLGDGNDTVKGAGVITSVLDLGAGNDTIGDPSLSPGSIDYAAMNSLRLDTVKLGEVGASGETNTVWAESARKIEGTDGIDIIWLQTLEGGGADPGINLGAGRTRNSVIVTGRIDSEITTEADDRQAGDSVEIGGGSADVKLANGLNIMTVKGEWTGSYEGGKHEDRMTVANGGSAEGTIMLLDGNDLFASQAQGAGPVQDLRTGGGADKVGGRIFEDGGSFTVDGYATGLHEVDLGGGDDIMYADSFHMLKAGAGNDSIYIKMGNISTKRMEMDLETGANNVWMSGGLEQSPNTLALTGSAGTDTLYLCDGGFAANGCGTDTSAGSPFHVILEASSANPWDSVHVHVMNPDTQSSLAVQGTVTLTNPEIGSLVVKSSRLDENDNTLESDDMLAIAGNYMLGGSSDMAATADLSSATVFGLDVTLDPGLTDDPSTPDVDERLTADMLMFDETARSKTGAVYPLIALHVSGDSSKGLDEVTKVKLVDIDASSVGVSGIRVVMHTKSGPVSFGDAVTVGTATETRTIDGGDWTISGVEENGSSVFYLNLHGFVLTAPNDTCGEPQHVIGDSRLLISQSWCGDYRGTDGVDTITANSTTGRKGGKWEMLEGHDRIVGSGSILSDIHMHDGDDVIGNPDKPMNDPENRLNLHGIVRLGEGNNTVIARGLGATGVLDGPRGIIWGGAGVDTIKLEHNLYEFALGEDEPTIHLGDGETGNFVSIRAFNFARIMSEATGDESNMDEVELGGADAGGNHIGYVSLGGGVNRLKAQEITWFGAYKGGDGKDKIELDSAKIEHWRAEVTDKLELGGGDDEITGSGTLDIVVEMGLGDDKIEQSQSGHLDLLEDVRLGGGENTVVVRTARMGIEGGDGKDTITLTGDGEHSLSKINLGGGENSVTIHGKATGKYKGMETNGEDEMLDTINVVQGASMDKATIEWAKVVGASGNTVKVAGNWTTEVGISGDDITLGGDGATVAIISEASTVTVANSGHFTVMGGKYADNVMLADGTGGQIQLGEGNNRLSSGGTLMQGYTGGAGQDTLILKGAFNSSGSEVDFDLKGGNNLVATESSDSGQVTRLALSQFKSDGGTKRLLVCGGQMGQDNQCGAGEGGFNVELDMQNAGDWDSFKVENNQTAGQARLEIKNGDIEFASGSSFGNARVTGDGVPGGGVIKLTGEQTFAHNTLFVIDVGKVRGGNDADLLDLSEATFDTGPLMDVRVAAGGLDQSADVTGKILVATVNVKTQDNKALPKLQRNREFLQIGSRLWTFQVDGETNPDTEEYYLVRTNVDLNEGATTGQHVASAAVTVAPPTSVFTGPPNTGFSLGGATQSQLGSGRTPVWASVSAGEQSGQIGMGSEKPEVEQSFWMFNSGSDVYTQNLRSARVTHSVVVQYGSVESKAKSGGSPTETSTLGFGYSGEILGASGAYGKVAAMSTELSGDAGAGADFSVGGTSVSAEAGWSMQMGSGSTFLTPSAKYNSTQFGDLSTPTGTYTELGSSSAEVGLRLDYGTSGADSRGRPTASNFYGGISFSQSLSGGFNYVPKTSDGKQALSIAVDNEKNWATLEGGWSFSFGGGNSAFVKFSAANANGGELAGTRQSYGVGFDLSW